MHTKIISARKEQAIDRIADGISRLGGESEINVFHRRPELAELFTLEAIADNLDSILLKLNEPKTTSPRVGQPKNVPAKLAKAKKPPKDAPVTPVATETPATTPEDTTGSSESSGNAGEKPSDGTE